MAKRVKRSRSGRKSRKKTSGSKLHFTTTLAIAILGALTLLYFYKVLSPNVMIQATDQLSAGIPIRQFQANELHHLRFPLWDPYLFSGIPFVDAMHGDIFYPSAFLRIFLPAHYVLTLVFIIHVFLAGLLMFILLRDMGLDIQGAFLWAISYAFTGVIVSQTLPGHDGKVIVSAFLPGVIFAIRRGMHEVKAKWFMLGALFLGLDILSPHVQMAYYTYLAAGIYFVFEWFHLLKEKGGGAAIKAIYLFVLMVVFSLAIGAIQLVPSYLYVSKFSPRGAGNRGYEFAISWSLPWEDYVSAFLAKFSGFLDSYWGRNPFKLNTEYLGVLPWLFAIAAFAPAAKSRDKWAMLFIFLFFSIMALGGYTPLYKLFYSFLPGVKKFRAPAMSFFVVAFSVNVLAAIGYLSLIEHDTIDFVKKVMLVLGVLTLILAFAASAGAFQGVIKSLFLKNATPEKLEIFRRYYGNIPSAFWRTFIFLIAGFVLAVQFSRGERNYALIAAILVIVDLWSINWRFLKKVPGPDRYYAPDAVVQYLKQDTTVYRVFPLLYRIDDNYLMYHGIESIGGHHGNQFQRYQEFVGEPHHFMFRPNMVPNLLRYPKFINMLNTKYIISQPLPEDLTRFDPQTRSLIRDIKGLLSTPGIEKIGTVQVGQGYYTIYRNNNDLGRVFLVQRYRVMESDKVLDYMKSSKFDPSQEAIFEDSVTIPIIEVPDFQWSVQFKKRTPNHIKLEVQTNGRAILVYSGNWYPYWRAYVDGQKTKVYRVDYILRAIEIPEGMHYVEFGYDGKYILYLAGVLLFSLLVVFVYLFKPDA